MPVLVVICSMTSTTPALQRAEIQSSQDHAVRDPFYDTIDLRICERRHGAPQRPLLPPRPQDAGARRRALLWAQQERNKKAAAQMKAAAAAEKARVRQERARVRKLLAEQAKAKKLKARRQNPTIPKRPASTSVEHLCCRLLKGRQDRVALSYDWLKQKIEDGICPRTGLAFVVPAPGKPVSLLQPSIDRIDSSQGYTEDNCQVVTLWYNMAKRNCSDEEFLEFAAAVVATSSSNPPFPA